MSSVQKTIPPPKNLKTLSRPPTSMLQIRKAMGTQYWSEERFKKFRSSVRATAERLKLDVHVSSEEQNPTKWKKLDELTVEQYPDLQQNYQNNWPLALYYNHWVSGHMRYLSNKNKPAQAQSTNVHCNSDSDSDFEMPLSASLSRSAPRRNSAPTAAKIQSTAGKRTAATDSDDDSEDPPLKKPRNSSNDALRRGTLPTPRSLNAASNRSANDSNSNISPANKTSFFFANFNRTPTSSGGAKRYYVGKDPSNFSRPPTSDSSKATSPKKASARPVAHSDDSDTDDPLGSGPPTGKSGQGSSQKSLRASQGTPSQPTNNPSATQTRPTLTGWPIWCVWCQLDTPPAVSEPYTVELRQLFPAPSDVPRVLAAIGILHDMHLRAFALRSKAERNAFLRSFIGSQYDQLKALQISKTLDQYAAEHAHQELPRWDMEACSYHQREHQVCTPPSLSKILHDLGMEELGPAAVFLGCRSEEQFQEARKFDEATKKEFLLDNVQIIKPSPFQKLMLQIALKPKV